MSCLTKKSLFLMVLSTVCNTTFSDTTAECKTNVNLVFKDQDPYKLFQLAMFALSEKVIDSMTTTVALSNDIITQYGIFMSMQTIRDQRKKRDAFAPVEYDNIRVIGEKIGDQNIKFSELGKKYILGYFELLINKFETINDPVITNINYPKKFCRIEFPRKALWECIEALAILFSKHVNRLHKIKTVMAFNELYLHHDYSEFTDDSFFEKFDGSNIDITSEQQGYQQYQISIMETYFSHIMEKINQIAVAQLKCRDPFLFPTIDDYCKGPGQYVA